MTPAASTAISTSPIAGFGIGRATAFRTSGPPGVVISIAVIVLGRVVMNRVLLCVGSIAPLDRTRETVNRLISTGSDNMEEEDLDPRRKTPKKRDLTPLSIDELEAYIAEMEGEILRVREAIAAKRKQRGGAESLFKS